MLVADLGALYQRASKKKPEPGVDVGDFLPEDVWHGEAGGILQCNDERGLAGQSRARRRLRQ